MVILTKWGVYVEAFIGVWKKDDHHVLFLEGTPHAIEEYCTYPYERVEDEHMLWDNLVVDVYCEGTLLPGYAVYQQSEIALMTSLGYIRGVPTATK